MFSKILVANRGEIACRVIKTARKLGIRTVAVYSEADKDALHVELADEAVAIGPASALRSYLVIEKIIEAVKQTGAEAVHPGYGFLSENAEFARALDKAGIAFIGPNIRAIEVMGDKIESKKFADDAKVNTVPGNPDLIKDADHAVKIAGEIGYPVMIKASAGGGGKGMRIAYSEEDVAQGFRSAASEAKSSFGDDRIFIEKFIENPRHIEIQVLADSFGNTIHLGERECSIQRRNQKVIEEAPSSFLDEETRNSMGSQAVALAKAVDYQSAGTVEFIVDKDKNFYFLEMNTRLQVEHPVTELITGLDLVAQMIRVAAGEKLSIKQKDVSFSGWAIESRIYAEDPYRNFLPSIGRLVRYLPPEEISEDGFTIRNDTGVFDGGEISMYYDPMIAKLITHGPDRESAIKLMASALDGFYIDGINHNISFLSALMNHERWIAGDISTKFIEEEYSEGFERQQPTGETLQVFSAVAAFLDHVHNRRRRSISDQMRDQDFTFTLKRVVELGPRKIDVSVAEKTSEILMMHFPGENEFATDELEIVSDWHPGQPVWRGSINGENIAVQVRPILNGYELRHGGYETDTRTYTKSEAEIAARMPEKVAKSSANVLRCPMPGLVVSLSIEEGQAVKAGDPLCTVEAMKMENILSSERDCVVKKILVNEGDTLAVDEVIMEFEPADS